MKNYLTGTDNYNPSKHVPETSSTSPDLESVSFGNISPGLQKL